MVGLGLGGRASCWMIVSTTVSCLSRSFSPQLASTPLWTSQLPPVCEIAVFVRKSLSMVPGRRADVSLTASLSLTHRRSERPSPHTRHGQPRRPRGPRPLWLSRCSGRALQWRRRRMTGGEQQGTLKKRRAEEALNVS